MTHPASPLTLARPAGWAPLAAAAAAAVALYIPVAVGMAAEWAEFPSLSHGFAVPLIAAYLLWHQRERIAAEPVSGSTLGLPLLALAVGLLVLGRLGGEPFVARLFLPLALFGVVLFLGGPGVARQAWMGIAYLVFMIPLPYLTLKSITYQSRLFDAGVTAAVLPWLGVPVLRDGVMLHLPNMSLEVADDCSSIPAIAALLALGAAYAQISPRPAWMRVVLTLSAAPLGLASNIVRIVLTALGAYHLGPIALENTIHKFNGTTVFLATVVLLVALDSLLLRLTRRPAS
jgi:exosortase